MNRFTLEEITLVISHILRGKQDSFLSTYAKSHEDYSKAFGVLEGVEFVRKEFSHVAKEIFRIEDED